jgi:acetate kinase
VAQLTSTPHRLLAVNVGSSSIKCGLFTCAADPDLLVHRTIAATGPDALNEVIAWTDGQTAPSALAAIGHRIVHGGPSHREPQLITRTLREDLTRLVAFAPNHLPQELSLIDRLAQRLPGVPQVACFDTAFHRGMPEVARRLPLPDSYHARGIQRYGFHGLSYAFLMEELARIAGNDTARGRVILAHLGNGSSLAAVRDGIGIDTTMAFTPIGGVVMSTRSGDLDPGVITYLARTERLSADAIEDLLSRHSGLLAVSGTTGDMQELLTREQTDQGARLAIESYVYSIVKAIGALTAALHGLDTLVFSGGIGEHASLIRARVCGAFTFLGVALDAAANARHAPVISASTSPIAVRVIPTNEELMIARAAYRASKAA